MYPPPNDPVEAETHKAQFLQSGHATFSLPPYHCVVDCTQLQQGIQKHFSMHLEPGRTVGDNDAAKPLMHTQHKRMSDLLNSRGYDVTPSAKGDNAIAACTVTPLKNQSLETIYADIEAARGSMIGRSARPPRTHSDGHGGRKYGQPRGDGSGKERTRP